MSGTTSRTPGKTASGVILSGAPSKRPSERQQLSERQIHAIYIISIVVMSVFTVLVIVSCFKLFGNEKDAAGLIISDIRDMAFDLMGMFICMILVISLSADKPWDRQNRSLFRLIFTLALLFFLDRFGTWLEERPSAVVALRVIYTVLYFAETLIVYCYWVYVREELELSGKGYRIVNNFCRGVLAVDFIADILNVRTGWFFTITESGTYVNTEYEKYTEITSFLLFMVILSAILAARNKSRREKAILMTFFTFPFVAHVLVITSTDYSLMYPSFLFSIMLIYINVFAARSRRLMEQQVILEQQRTALMISQIQPHFLYNVLTTISNLCVKDPEEAEETTVLFSQYLRTNLDSLRKTEPVSFGEELGHIRTYVELEKKRFGEKLNASYDIEETGFLVPSLGLQPIVENSVKHGIRGKDSPGHLKVSSSRTDAGFVVVIEDDGVGFDPSAPVPDDGRSHVGMVNVRARLEQMCGAQMTIESSPGNGCRTTVVFPLSDAVQNVK